MNDGVGGEHGDEDGGSGDDDADVSGVVRLKHVRFHRIPERQVPANRCFNSKYKLHKKRI